MKAGIRTAVLTMLLLMLLSFINISGASNDDYFGAVNNELLRPFTKRYMPVMVNNKLMVPHFLLIDSDIGARTEWSEQQHYLTLTCVSKSVTFELGPKIAFDANNRIYETIMLRNEYSGVVYYYLELDFICDFFEWSYSNNSTEYGNIIRIKTKDGLWSDSQYLLSERDRLLEYYNTLYPTPPPAVSQAPPISPTPPPVTPPPTPMVPESPLGVYITFDGALNEHTESLLDILESYDVRASFFLTEDGLSEHPALLRRLAATQTVGLCGPEPVNGVLLDGASYLEQAERMNRTLDQITVTKTRLTRWPGLHALNGKNAEEQSAPAREALDGGGYRLWGWTLDAGAWPQLTPGALSGILVSALPASGEGPAVLRLGMDKRSVQTLPLLLEALSDPNAYFLRSIGITDRPIS